MEGSIGIGLLYIGLTISVSVSVSVWPYRSNPILPLYVLAGVAELDQGLPLLYTIKRRSFLVASQSLHGFYELLLQPQDLPLRCLYLGA